jgi:adenylate cyclase
LALLAEVRELTVEKRLSMTMLPVIDAYLARARADAGDVDGAITLSHNVVSDFYATGATLHLGTAVEVLGELLLRRGEANDLDEVGAAVDRLSAVRADNGFVLHQLSLLRLRALLARARGDEAGYSAYADDYGDLVASIDFRGRPLLAG